MTCKLLAWFGCAGVAIFLALGSSVFGFGTGVATRPGKIVGIDGQGTYVAPSSSGDDIVAIGGGKDVYLALRYDGSVMAWGVDRFGAVKNQPRGNNFIGISCGMDHCLAMKSDGSIIFWGGCEAGFTKALQ